MALALNGIVGSISVLASHALVITLSISTGNLHLVCSGVHASHIPVNRQFLWNHLRGVSATITTLWVLVGDFNDTLASTERRGGIFSPSRAQTFLDNLNSYNLLDIGATGMAFISFRNCQGQLPVHKRLDRALASLQWRVDFPKGGVEVLPRLHSDHSPLLLRCGRKIENTGSRPFRFEAAWAMHPLYGDVVQEAWQKGGPNVLEDLHEVKNDSIEFNKKTLGNIFRRKRHVENCMASIQMRLETVDSMALLLKLANLKKEYNDILAQEEMLWFQKSKEKWVKYGDRNTAFFHAQTVTLGVDTSCLPTSGLPTIPAHFIPDLEREVTKEEVYMALQHMGSFKAPGSDGFHAFFYKSYRDVVGDAFYQIRPILNEIISPMQSSFIPGRSTSDNAITLQEIVHHQHKARRKSGNLVFKLDLEKAYDLVDWHFLRETMVAFGFPQSYVTLIMYCVSVSQLAILWNGERLHPFAAKRGLRQGDPLSPYLFVLCMERISSAISTAVQEGRWDPICTVRNGPGLSHVFFVDDVLLFVKAKVSQVAYLCLYSLP
ncbi:uncharacterized protein LOC130744863 [Lotus japonicus]|uniref:uncharacterized protein LOC130744863 n=1 Tax=Lotus japonicus TaxID=34305 RepID=UPI00258352AC|nr:uncharacterized protein LOC130744863 [Lotus japonicus]